MTTTSIIIIVLVLVTVSVWYDRRKKIKQTIKTFDRRDAVDTQSFYERYYRDKGIDIQIIRGIREVLEKVLDADMSRIQPSDDFTTNLKFYFDSDSMADVEIVVGLEKTFEIIISDEEAQRTKTIDDIVMLVDSKMKLNKA